MRTTSIREIPAEWDNGKVHQTRVYDDTDKEFCCHCHFGVENRAIMELLDLTWGYDVVEDRMMILPIRYRHELVRRIDQFSARTPAEIRKVLEGIADVRAGVDSKP